MLSSRRTGLVGRLKRAWLRNKAVLAMDVCELCGDPCMPQASNVSVCVPACKAVADGAFERASAQTAHEFAEPYSLELVA